MIDQSGATYAAFAVSLSKAATSDVVIGWETQDGTAKAGTDYVKGSGSLRFAAGETAKTILILVNGLDKAPATAKTFSILLLPSPDAIISKALIDCSITVTDQNNSLLTTVVIPGGPSGKQGDQGDRGSIWFAGNGAPASATGINDDWYLDVAAETLGNIYHKQQDDWIKTGSLRGKQGDLGATGTSLTNQGAWVSGTTYIAGSFVSAAGSATNTALWFLRGSDNYLSTTEPAQDLTHWLELPALQGENGERLMLQVGGGFIQYKYPSSDSWTNLIAVSDISGKDGKDGVSLVSKGAWVNGKTYNAGNYVSATGSATAKSLFFLQDTSDYHSTVEPASDPEHWVELASVAGPMGEKLQIQVNGTLLQAKYESANSWTTLYDLVQLKGTDGKDGSDGSDGEKLQIQASGTNLQIKYASEASWTNIFDLSVLKGSDGSDGHDGKNGAVWLSGNGAPAGSLGVTGDFYVDVADSSAVTMYEKTSGGWSSLVTLSGGGGGGGVTFATDEQAQAGKETSVALSPANLAAVLNGLALGSTYLNSATDLNKALTNNAFAWANTTLNIPVSGTYGRGYTFASSTTDATQIAIVNGTGKRYIRFMNAGKWDSAWTDLDALLTQPYCSWTNPGGATFTTGVWAKVGLYTKGEDLNGMSNGTTFTAPSAGIYQFELYVQVTVGATNGPKAGTVVMLQTAVSSSTPTAVRAGCCGSVIAGTLSVLTVTFTERLAKGETRSLYITHNNGTNMALTAAAMKATRISA